MLDSFRFLTPPQMAYIAYYIDTLNEGLATIEPNSKQEIVIDMDAVADSVATEPRSDFYPASVTQQTQFACAKCDAFNDVRGRYAYCANCGWRNNRATTEVALQRIRDNINAGQTTPSDAVKQAVSEFDSVSRNYADELQRRVPMKASLRKELQGQLFHSIEQADILLREVFRIDILRKMDNDRPFVKKMFMRRHVYEHDGGVATQRYIHEGGDTDVREGDLIRETKENAHNLISCINRMLSSFDDDFHGIFPQHEYGRNLTDQVAKRGAGREKRP